MDRTQIYFDKSEKEKLISVAKIKGKPMAEIVREAVAEYLLKEQKLLKPVEDPIKELRGFMEGSKFTADTYIQQKNQDKELEK